jgi:prepilin-type N-terminal cleavage/methylation domain-containing protein
MSARRRTTDAESRRGMYARANRRGQSSVRAVAAAARLGKEGFTLLEIVLSLAILAGSLAALGEVMRLGDRNAEMVRDESQAQVLASSVMDELLAGSMQMMAVNRVPFEYQSEPQWVYSVAFEPTHYVELLLARVRVEQDLPPEREPARFELVRWVANPDLVASATNEAGSSQSSSGGGSSGTSGSSSSGGQSNGGGP